MEQEIRSFVLAELKKLDIGVADDIGDATPLGDEGLGMESLFVMQLVMKLEQEYGLTLIDDPAAIKSLTYGELIGCVVDGTTVPAKEGTLS
jgi:acyl carrier protein